jgi:hypothetical protein
MSDRGGQRGEREQGKQGGVRGGRGREREKEREREREASCTHLSRMGYSGCCGKRYNRPYYYFLIHEGWISIPSRSLYRNIFY